MQKPDSPERTSVTVDESLLQYTALRRRREGAAALRSSATEAEMLDEALVERIDEAWHRAELKHSLVEASIPELEGFTLERTDYVEMRELATRTLERSRSASNDYRSVSVLCQEAFERARQRERRRFDAEEARLALFRALFTADRGGRDLLSLYPVDVQSLVSDATAASRIRFHDALDEAKTFLETVETQFETDRAGAVARLDTAGTDLERTLNAAHREWISSVMDELSRLTTSERERGRDAYHRVIREGDEETIAAADDAWSELVRAYDSEEGYYGPDPGSVFETLRASASRLEGLSEA